MDFRRYFKASFLLRAAGVTAICLILCEVLLRVAAWVGFGGPQTAARFDEITVESDGPAQRIETVTNKAMPGLEPRFRIITNSLGFRGPEPCNHGEDGCELKIVTVGGSTTRCGTLDEKDTWTFVLGRDLASVSRLGVQTINAGKDGHSSKAHESLLQHIIDSTRPDIMIFMTGANDLGYHIPLRLTSKPGLFDRTATQQAQPLMLPRLVSDVGFVIGLKTERHHRCSLSDLKAVLPIPNANVLAAIRDELPKYRSRLINIGKIAASNGIIPVFLTQPTVCGGNNYPSGLDLRRIPMMSWEPDKEIFRSSDMTTESSVKSCSMVYGPRCDRFNSYLERFNDQVRQVARENGWPLIDVAAKMDKTTRNFRDAIHFSAEGSIRVGRMVSKALYEEILPGYIFPAVLPTNDDSQFRQLP